MIKIFSRFFIAVFLGLSLLTVATAKSPVPALNLSSNGLALRGYDPVAYFTIGSPVKGKQDITVKNGGAIYYFASAENKAQFLQNPKKYLPQYGGYCAYGTAVKAKVDGDPRVWHIVNGKLYLNITRSVDRTWNRGRSTYIKQANRNWTKLRSQ